MKGEKVYLLHMRDALQRIVEYKSRLAMNGSCREPHWQDATIRQLEVVGEAAKRITLETRDLYSEIPWRRVAGLRDVLIHQYFGIDIETVWTIAIAELPELLKRIDVLIANLNESR